MLDDVCPFVYLAFVGMQLVLEGFADDQSRTNLRVRDQNISRSGVFSKEMIAMDPILLKLKKSLRHYLVVKMKIVEFDDLYDYSR